MNTERNSHPRLAGLLAGTTLLALSLAPAGAQDWRPAGPQDVAPASQGRGPHRESSFIRLVALEHTSTQDDALPGEPDMPPADYDAEPQPEPLTPEPDHGPTAGLGACRTCQTYGCDCRPQWYGSFEVVWLDRSRPKPFSLSVEDISPPAERIVLDTEDLGFGYEPGVRVMIGHWLNECTSVEAEYLGLHDFDSSASSPFSAGSDIDPFWGNDIEDIETGNFQNAVLHEADYSSRLHSVELNVRRWRSPETSYFTGVRYIQIDEDFDFLSFDDQVGGVIDLEDFGLYSVETDNHLIGLQVGGTRQTSGDRFRLGVRGKAGLFLNFLSQESRLLDINLNNVPPARTDLTTRESDVALATVVELGVFGMYRVTDRCWARVGYDLLFVSGLALASEQLDIPQWVNSRNSLSDNGSVIYHGPSAGVAFDW